MTNISETTIIHEPNNAEADSLNEWYKNEGKEAINEKLMNSALKN